jgi:undecaprenyl phosphate N,N'-diacetylbacillosamine 1-phosphate transferase
MSLYPNYIKPLGDFIISFVGFIILFPVFALVTVLFFFTQLRPGKNERIFRLVKFKTMSDRKDVHGNLLPDADRLTSFGKFVRKTSLDEIPQLLNVMKGDMSLVGPRPLLVEYLPLYNEMEKQRHLVKPGITGWAQVNGRNAISWQQKFAFDVYYAHHVSFLLDFKIIVATIGKVFRSEGIAAEGHVTTEKFKGTNPTLHAQ